MRKCRRFVSVALLEAHGAGREGVRVDVEDEVVAGGGVAPRLHHQHPEWHILRGFPVLSAHEADHATEQAEEQDHQERRVQQRRSEAVGARHTRRRL